MRHDERRTQDGSQLETGGKEWGRKEKKGEKEEGDEEE